MPRHSRWSLPSSRSTPRSTTRTRFGTGTGFVISPGGEVLTNFHVVQGADMINAHNIGTGRDFPVDLIGYDRSHDIALVQLRGATGLPTAPLGNSAQVAVGDPAVAIGNAGGPGSPPTFEAGTVTQLGRTHRRQGRADGQFRSADRPDRGRRERPGRRLGWPAGERRRTGYRRDHGGDGELPVRPRRQGFRDTDQPGDGDRRPDPGPRAVRHRAHRTPHSSRRRCLRRRATRIIAGRHHPRGVARRTRRGSRPASPGTSSPASTAHRWIRQPH